MCAIRRWIKDTVSAGAGRTVVDGESAARI